MMSRSQGVMTSRRRCLLLLAASFLFTTTSAVPLPNMTSADIGLKAGSCAVGDVVYMTGDEFPGSSACESCVCSVDGVQCAKQTCEPRPGCKALHRPDHCCPTYQCECEQEGRVYNNGEKLVDPADPCRVCYCQGGEVVCRRIACFVRDDCRPRLVPGRCCPEYDDCPLRGVTAIPGVTPAISSVSTPGIYEANNVAPVAPKENIRQEITIKEITPVSEIPAITEVKIKEILPSPSIDVAEYPSSKSPLIPREVTPENIKTSDSDMKTESGYPTLTEVHSTASSNIVTFVNSNYNYNEKQVNNTNDSRPSKISFSTQDSINSEIYPSNISTLATMGSSSMEPDSTSAGIISITTKSPIIEEEDTSLFDHNPAFPPIPDDLSVMSNHDEEIISEQILDSENTPSVHEFGVPIVGSTTLGPLVTEILTTTAKYPLEDVLTTTAKLPEITVKELTSTVKNTEMTSMKSSSMLDLRSAIPTDILNSPSFVHEEITGELDDTTESNEYEENTLSDKKPSSDNIKAQENVSIQSTTPELLTSTTFVVPTATSLSSIETTRQDIDKTNLPTEVTSRTELSSFPIETSDQNPHETSDVVTKDKTTTDSGSEVSEILTTQSPLSTTKRNIIDLTKAKTDSNNNKIENVETTEFIMSSFGSSESATDVIELVKIPANMDTKAAFIEQSPRENTNIFTDLINLVGDVASISDHTEVTMQQPSSDSEFAVSEDLIPVNFGYKSKNNNRNVNSITEMPLKSKVQGTKQKIIEIEDEDTDNITDSQPPNDKMEPTTKRPIIDNVSNDMAGNKTDKKDIEIITQSYVPIINKRPNKVIMKKPDEATTAQYAIADDVLVSASKEQVTEHGTALSETNTVLPKLNILPGDIKTAAVDQAVSMTTAAP